MFFVFFRDANVCRQEKIEKQTKQKKRKDYETIITMKKKRSEKKKGEERSLLFQVREPTTLFPDLMLSRSVQVGLSSFPVLETGEEDFQTAKVDRLEDPAV